MTHAERKWAGTTFGTGWMHRKLVGMLRHADVRLFYAFTFVFVVPPCLIFGKSGRIVYRYLRCRHGFGRWHALRLTWRNHWLFSQVVIDRFAMYAGRRFKVDIEGYEHYTRLETHPGAFMQLSAHVGNYEIAGYTLRAERKRFNALVFGGEKQSVMEGRNRLLEADNIRLIAVRPDMGHLFEVNAALEAGECVSMPADRIFGSPRSIGVSMLGAEARLPLGPFRVATMRGLPVLAVNVVKTAALTYRIIVAPLAYDAQAPAAERTRQLAQAYADELGRVLRSWPEQWYNFYNFWND